MDCILYPNQYRVIFNVSFLSLGTCCYAIYNKQYVISLCPAGVFLTSINYWRKPDYSWRRNLDMTYVKCALFFQIYKAYRSKYMIQYYSLMGLALSFYQFGVYYHAKKRFWRSTYAHCALHIISNIANLVLYSGL
jgi:hypothetical protein